MKRFSPNLIDPIRSMQQQQQQDFQRKQAFQAVELVPDTHRLLLMNAMLHGIESDLLPGDTLSPTGARLPKADVILTNPPFGTTRGGGKPTRDDFTFVTGNKQQVWVYDQRTNMPAFGKRTLLTHAHFAEFETCCGRAKLPLSRFRVQRRFWQRLGGSLALPG